MIKISKILVLGSTLVMGAQAFAADPTPFNCTSRLDYAVWDSHNFKHILTTDLLITGLRSETDTLVGGVTIDVGDTNTGVTESTLLNPAPTLSSSVVMLQGAKDRQGEQVGISLNFRFLKNQDGSQNRSNTAQVVITTKDGDTKFSNKVLAKVGVGETGEAYPINCDIQ